MNYPDSIINLLYEEIPDFSIEFFLITNKSILFIDAPPKINNINFDTLKLNSLEKIIKLPFLFS